MDFSLTPEQQQVRELTAKVCQKFDDAYWRAHDISGEYPEEFYRAIVDAGLIGIAMPAQHGGSGLGIVEAAIMMQAIAESGAAMSGASAIHMNIFGLQPVVVFGTPEQKARMLPPLIRGEHKTCFAVTEPDAGLDTTRIKTKAERRGDSYVISGQKIWISTAQVAHKMMILVRTTPREEVKRKTDGLSLFYTDLDRSRVEVRKIDKMGRHAVNSNMLFFDRIVVPAADLIGEEGNGFRQILHRDESRAHSDRRGSRRAWPRGAAARGQLRQGTCRVRPADRAEPGHRASAGEMLDGARSGRPDGHEGSDAL